MSAHELLFSLPAPLQGQIMASCPPEPRKSLKNLQCSALAGTWEQAELARENSLAISDLGNTCGIPPGGKTRISIISYLHFFPCTLKQENSKKHGYPCLVIRASKGCF